MPTFYVTSSIIAVFVLVILGFWVFFNNRHGKVNQSFLAWTLCLASWVSWDVINASQGFGLDPAIVLWLGRFLHIGAIGMAAAVTWWTNTLVGKERDRVVLPTVSIACLILILFDLATPLLIKNVTYKEVEGVTRMAAEYGIFYNLFYAVFAFSGFYLIFQLIVCFRKVGSYKRNQIRYIILAAAIGFLISSPVYFLNAIGLKIPQIDNIGLIFVAGSIAYGIVRYRAMDVTLIIKKGIVYTLTLGLVVGGYVIMIIALQVILQTFFGLHELPSVLVTALAALTISLVFQPVKNQITQIVDRFFYKGKYDYQQTLMKFSKVVAATLSLDSLSKFVVNIIQETMKPETALFLLLDERGGNYGLVSAGAPNKTENKPIRLEGDSAIINRLMSKETVIIKEGIEQYCSKAEAEKIKTEFQNIGCEMALPLVFQGKLVGAVCLGEKISGEIYSQADIELLLTMLNQTAVAIQNARLYGEVVASRDFSENILENLTSAVITVDAQGRVTAFNHQAEEMIGRHSDEVIGKPLEELGDRKNQWVAELMVDTLKKGKRYSNYETPLNRDGGHSVPLGVSTFPLRDFNEQISGAIMVLTDLSSVKELEEKVRRSDRLASLGTMAAGMAHEIRNPLSSVKTFIQLLPRKFSDPEFRVNFSQIAAEEVEKINTMITRLLDFARPRPLKLQPVNATQAIDEILLLLNNDLNKNQVEVKRLYEGDASDILVDKEQIKQVLLNLILNSIQAMHPGGELKVMTRPGDGKMTVTISDTGCGIKPENLQRIFDPFFSTKTSGSGLGLAIVHRIIEEHRGTIDVRSEEGKGTEFVIELPLVGKS